jgi:hypothetical protein
MTVEESATDEVELAGNKIVLLEGAANGRLVVL